MNLKNKKRFLTSQIIELENLLKSVGDEPFMMQNLQSKIDVLKEELKAVPEVLKESKVQLLFSGNAVIGSKGIKSTFISKVVKPFQELIKTESAMVRFGTVGSRGLAKKAGETNLYLTALPRGSFGIELTHLNSKDLFNEEDISTAISNVITLVESTAESDEKFEDVIGSASGRHLNNLRKFLKEIKDEHSILKMDSGSKTLVLPEEKILQAFDRVDSTQTDEHEDLRRGVLRGVLLESGKFEFVDSTGQMISGSIHESLSEEDIFHFDREYLNKECIVSFLVRTTIFKTGRTKTVYELLSIRPI